MSNPQAHFILSGTFDGDVDNQLLRRIKRLQASVETLEGQISGLSSLTATTTTTTVHTGTHSQRLALSPASVEPGTLFYETDTTTLYICLQSGATRIWSVV